METTPFSPIRTAAAVAAFLLLALAAPRASAITFDFENQVATATTGAYSTLALSNSGLTMTLSRQGGSKFDIIDSSGSNFPSSFATRALDPFFDTSASAFVANFSSTLSGFSLEFGDGGQDRDQLTLSAYSGLNGTGTLLGTVTVLWNGNFTTGDPAAVASLSGLSGIQSVVFIGGSRRFFPNSVYYDNFVATLDSQGVPEGGSSLLLLGFGFIGVFVAGRLLALRQPISARARS